MLRKLMLIFRRWWWKRSNRRTTSNIEAAIEGSEKGLKVQGSYVSECPLSKGDLLGLLDLLYPYYPYLRLPEQKETYLVTYLY